MAEGEQKLVKVKWTVIHEKCSPSFACICVSILFLSGCWDRMEVNDLAIVTAAAIDRKGIIKLNYPSKYLYRKQ